MSKYKPETVVAQPSLLHMWNLRSRTRKEGGEETNGLKSNDPGELSSLNRDRDDATATRTMTDDDDLSEYRRSSKSEDEVVEKVELNEPLNQPVTVIDVEEGSSSNDNTTFPTENENTDSDAQSRQLAKGEESLAKGRNRKMNSGKPHRELFPLFKRKEKESMNAVIYDTTSSSDKNEVQHSSRTTDIASGKSSRGRKSNRTPNDRRTRLAPENFLDDTFAGPSTQRLIGSQDTTHERRVNRVTKSSSPVAGGSQEQLIVIESSPVREIAPEYTPLDSPPTLAGKRISVRGNRPQNFFAPRKNFSTSDTVRRKVGEGDRVELPNRDNQHVRGAQHSFSSTPFESPRRHQPKALEADLSNTFSESSESISYLRTSDVSQDAREPRYLFQAVSSGQDAHARCEEILKMIGRPCPAISRVLSADPTDASGTSWNEKWRPRRAREVLGNEASSLYLKEWLLALELEERDGHSARYTETAPEMSIYSSGKRSQGTKRPQVIRTVDKPRKRRKRIDSDEESLGDWITSDEEETPLPVAYSEHEDDGSEDGELGSPWRPRFTRLSCRPPPGRDESDNVNNGTAPPARSPTHDFSDRLTNTILLNGPSGSGKTATVYACAEELGWEVFEVYPGIGKRNGSNLLSLVGDVGKNHIVNRPSRAPTLALSTSSVSQEKESSRMTKHSSVASKGDRRGASSDGLTSFFSHKRPVAHSADDAVAVADSKRSISPNGRVQASESDVANAATFNLNAPAEGDGAAALASSTESKASGRAATQQSIILLEEVDILFSEDIHFWPTVVALIRESRRPVIMTCNDPTLVPSASLPLQTILPLQACPPDLTVSYLQCIALKEGYAVSEAHVKSLYGRRQSIDVLDTRDDFLRAATYPNPNPLPDLRCAINSLQFQCQGSHGINASEINSSTAECKLHENYDALAEASAWDWRQHFGVDCLPTSVTEPEGPGRKQQHGAMSLWRLSDSLSMIDSYLARCPTDSLQILGCSTGDSSDDELGYTCLQYKPEVEHLQGGIIMYNRDEAIASEAVACAARVAGNSAGGRAEKGWKPPPSLLLEMCSHFARVSGVLEKIVPWVARQSVGAVVLDYEPWVRFIDRRDTEQEVAAMKEAETRTGVRGVRTTRNSQRVQYERYFGLTEEERERLWCGEYKVHS